MRGSLRNLALWGGLTVIAIAAIAFAFFLLGRQRPVSRISHDLKRTESKSDFRRQHFDNLTVWWDEIPNEIRQYGCPSGVDSNIFPKDYAGPESCKNCHKKQYESWSNHPHRWMNSLVENITVYGDFDDRHISYLAGDVTFFRESDQYRMRLERGDVRRIFVVEQTIGSRFFQYYVGRQVEGPESSDHPLYSESHVLPLGYWIDRKEWVPIVHVHAESHERERYDPFAPRPPYDGDFDKYADRTVDLYRSQCNFCHTTFAIGDMFMRKQKSFGQYVPVKLDVAIADYVQKARPDLWPAGRKSSETQNEEFAQILRVLHRLDARTEAVTLGISCEACHLGAKDHAQGKLKRPKFFPSGSDIVVRTENATCDAGRTHDNVNWACGRCHSGDRPMYANGIATWNSTEYSDAVKGSCYSKLTCVHCHNPHEAIGHEWTRTAAQDDASCLKCHEKYEPDAARIAHTHHPLNHEGSRCMNCHMPRINEGLQEVVRTHTIFSPTNPTMIVKNQMNACNLCHVDQPIDWTLTHLKDWYGKSFAKSKPDSKDSKRDQPVAMTWLKSNNESVRLVAADALTRADARWALPELIHALDDPYLLNRQFARIGLERMLSLKLSDFGYQFYQTPKERVEPLKKLKEQLIPDQAEQKAAGN